MPQWLGEWWPVIVLAVTAIVVPALRWSLRSGLATKEDVVTLTERLTKTEQRVSTAVAQIEQLPTNQTITELRLAVERLNGAIGMSNEGMAGLRTLMERVDRQVERHEAIFADAARMK